MKVILLGTAAGGGCPQWNCACALCTSGLTARSQDCVAVSPDGSGWYLLNCSPDIRAQILGTPELRAGPGPREIPLRGVLLTDAELDHSMGLLMLREAGGLPVSAPAAALDALSPIRAIIDGYGGWTPLTDLPDLQVSSLPVSDKKPKYVTSAGPGPWVVAYRITDLSTGGVLVYAPCLKSWPPGFDAFVEGASLVLLDGTFYAPDEMAGVGGPDQLAMGHLPITASLPRITGRPGHWAFTHLNNTNPVLDPTSPEHAAVLSAGALLPADGATFEL